MRVKWTQNLETRSSQDMCHTKTSLDVGVVVPLDVLGEGVLTRPADCKREFCHPTVALAAACVSMAWVFCVLNRPEKNAQSWSRGASKLTQGLGLVRGDGELLIPEGEGSLGKVSDGLRQQQTK
jgi:hypothetical protein